MSELKSTLTPENLKGAYGEIVKASAVLASARAVSLAIGLLRVKVVAMVLGPTGIGLIGAYELIVTTLVGLGSGIHTGSVRQIAAARGEGNISASGRAVTTHQRLTLIIGCTGAALVICFSTQLAEWASSRSELRSQVVWLAPVILLGCLENGIRARLRALNMTTRLVQITLGAAIVDAVWLSVLVAFFLSGGIVPALIASAITGLAFAAIATRGKLPSFDACSWRETMIEGRVILGLGLGVSAGFFISMLVAFSSRAWITTDFGLGAAGIYLCAYTLSGKFIGFILEAMRMDLFPRLCAVSGNNAQVNQLVNQQTEIVLLMTLPGLVATIALAPLLIGLLYSELFIGAIELMRWFVLGSLFRAMWVPVGYVRLAKGNSRTYFVSEVLINLIHLALVFTLIKTNGLVGVAMAYACINIIQFILLTGLARSSTGLRWSRPTINLVVRSVGIALLAVGISYYPGGATSAVAGGMVALAASLYCMRNVISRLGAEHRVSKMLLRLPIFGQFFGAVPL